jgi:hypothetical protein
MHSEKDAKNVFTHIHDSNSWGSNESKSGIGSTLEQTAVLRPELEKLIAQFGIKTMLDIPCGDFNWMQHVNLTGVNYTGADIVEKLVKKNNATYGTNSISFRNIDLILEKNIPKVDLIFCRDCLVHLDYRSIFKAIANLKNSGSKYLLTTSFPSRDKNQNIEIGGWRTLNFEKAPFNFPLPTLTINEHCTEGNGKYTDKSMMLWDLEKLPVLPTSTLKYYWHSLFH